MRICPHLGVSPHWSAVRRTHSAEVNISFFPIQKIHPNTNTKNNPSIIFVPVSIALFNVTFQSQPSKGRVHTFIYIFSK